MSKATSRTFRPWPKNQERLELAEKLNLNVSELINETLERSFKAVLEGKAKQLREALDVPVS